MNTAAVASAFIASRSRRTSAGSEAAGPAGRARGRGRSSRRPRRGTARRSRGWSACRRRRTRRRPGGAGTVAHRARSAARLAAMRGRAAVARRLRLVPPPARRHPGRRRRPGARRRQRRQAALAGRRARSIATSTPSTAASARAGPRRAVSRPLFDADAVGDAVRRRGVRLRRVLARARARPRPGGGGRRAVAGRRGPGYIEVPEAASAKILDFPSHVWWCRLDGSTLVFTAEARRGRSTPRSPTTSSGPASSAGSTELLDSEFDERVDRCALARTASTCASRAPADPAFLARPRSPTARTSAGSRRSPRGCSRLRCTLPPPARRRRAPIRYDDVVKPELRRGDGSILERRVYRVD